jgi:hypothetical protein
MLGRSLLIKASGARLLYPGYVQDYLDRVTAADVAAGNTLGLERGVTDAFNTCLQALVADGILGVSGGVLTQAASLIKASCFMQGARTLSGSLVPLAADMPAPTNFNFVAGDYNRRTGLGNPANATKYLNSNRNSNSDPQDDTHIAVWISTQSTGGANGIFLAAGDFVTPGSSALQTANFNAIMFTRSRNATGFAAATKVTGFFGLSRNSSTAYSRRFSGSTATETSISQTPVNDNYFVFRGNAATPSITNARLSFYSIGESLDLAILDARITALANAIQAAIAP